MLAFNFKGPDIWCYIIQNPDMGVVHFTVWMLVAKTM